MNNNYRVIRKDEPSGETAYVIHQVSYNEQDVIQLISADPASPSGETITELKESMEQIRQALDLPILEMEDVLDSVEASGAVSYGTWFRKQIRDPLSEADIPAEVIVSLEKVQQTQQQKLELLAAKFAEKRRNNLI